MCKKGFKYSALKQLNDMPADTQEASTLKCFKKEQKGIYIYIYIYIYIIYKFVQDTSLNFLSFYQFSDGDWSLVSSSYYLIAAACTTFSLLQIPTASSS